MKKMFIIFAFLVVGYAVFPLFGKNYIPTHDGEYHIVRIVEFAKMLGEGYIVPRWAPDLNSGYGIPIFMFHYPLPDYIGSFVRVFTRDAVYAFQASLGIAYICVVIGAFLWLAALFGTLPAVVGAITAAFVPYLFVDTYIRGTIGEVWAITFLFLSLYALEKKKYVLLAVFYGLLILSHNIMAMLFTPVLAGYIWIRDKRNLWWMLGGIGLSAFFWMPALLESKYVVGLNTVNYRDYFVSWYELLVPSWGSGFAGSGIGTAMSVQIGVIPILVVIAALFRKSKAAKRRLLWYFAGILLISIALMLPVSLPIWNLVKPLQLTQYPWRFLSFVVPVAGFCAAYLASSTKKQWVGILIAVLAVLFSFSYARPVLYAPRNEAYYMSRPNFSQGTSSMGNSFSTVWTGWIRERNPKDPVHTLYFPGWKAYVNGKEVPIVNDHGVIQTQPGAALRFTETPIRLTADIISLGTLLGLSVICMLPLILRRR